MLVHVYTVYAHVHVYTCICTRTHVHVSPNKAIGKHIYTYNVHVHAYITQCDTIDTTPGLEARLEIFRKSEVTSVLPFLRLLLPPASDSELEPSLDELPLLLLLLELLLEL